MASTLKSPLTRPRWAFGECGTMPPKVSSSPPLPRGVCLGAFPFLFAGASKGKKDRSGILLSTGGLRGIKPGWPRTVGFWPGSTNVGSESTKFQLGSTKHAPVSAPGARFDQTWKFGLASTWPDLTQPWPNSLRFGAIRPNLCFLLLFWFCRSSKKQH